MGTRRTTFGKTQREREKRAKAAAKRERRAATRSHQPEEAPAPVVEAENQEALLSALAALHERYADGGLDLQEFEARRDELRSRLHVT